MTARDLCDLCAFSYINLPPGAVRKLADGPFPLREACEAIALSPPCGGLSAATEAALARLAAKNWALLSYVNKNPSTGFAAIAVREGSLVAIAMRGSESGDCAPSPIDWKDNFLAPFRGSVQYEDAYSLVNRYPAGELIVTGHSKGGHNALYALAVAKNPAASAAAFNGQGFARGQLSRAQKRRLKALGTNYVTRADVVGALIYHPETRVFCAMRPGENAHALSAFRFGPDGAPAEAPRAALSVAVELGSRILLGGLRNLQWRGKMA